MSTVEFVVQRVANECRKTDPVAIAYLDVSWCLFTFSRPCRKAKLGTESPMADFHISYCASFYFAKHAQRMVLERREEVLTYFLFPGAFITALVPAYTLFLFLIGSKCIAPSFSNFSLPLSTLWSIDMVEKPINHYSGHRNVQPDW